MVRSLLGVVAQYEGNLVYCKTGSSQHKD